MENCAEIEKLAEKQEAEAAQKERNAEAQALWKEVLLQVEEWKNIKEMHEANLRAWDEECKKLALTEISEKEWPKKPVCPCKPKVSTAGQEQGEAESEQNDNNEEEEE
ncbi:hypothetical protein C0995_009625 [Termitomyces sp. Mi166|nr:hypothetical protein C0995_009625 [Termitomyces sp. Mi166\